MVLIRNSVIAFVVIVLIGVGGYGLFYSTGVGAPTEWQAGEHYVVLDNPPPLRADAPIEVEEFFSYGCIHCRNLDPLIEEWRAQAPDDVEFRRTPVAFGAWEVLSRGYFALEATGALEENHERLFRAIHDQGRTFVNAEMLADFVAGHGVSREDFLTAYNSPSVVRAANRADRRIRSLRIASVPTLLVANRYLISVGNVSRAEALPLVDYLVAQVRAAETVASEPAADEPPA